MVAALLLAALHALIPAPRPSAPVFDLMPPGYKRVDHELVLEDAGALDGRRLVAFPVRGLRGAHVVLPGEPFPISAKYGTLLYVADAIEQVPDDPGPSWRDDHVALALPVQALAAVPAANPLARLVTSFRVEANAGGELRLVPVTETRYDKSGSEFEVAPLALLIAVVGGLGLLGVVRLARSARRREPLAQESR